MSFIVLSGTAEAQSVDSLANEVISSVQDSIANNPDKLEKADPKISELRELISFSKILLSLFVIVFAFLFNKALAFLLGRLAEVKAYYRLLVKRLIPFLSRHRNSLMPPRLSPVMRLLSTMICISGLNGWRP